MAKKAKAEKKVVDRSKIGRSSKNKGKVGEREFCKFMRELGMDAQRTVQYKGTGSSADVESSYFAFIHPEVKRTEQSSFYAWYEQADIDCDGHVKDPVIFHRKNKGRWMAFVDAELFLFLVKAIAEEGFKITKGNK